VEKMKAKVSREKQKSNAYKEKYFEVHKKMLQVKEYLKGLAISQAEADIHEKLKLLETDV